MLSLSMAFIAKPSLLIIDELSLGLAPTVIESLLGIVNGIHDHGTAVILVEQSINLALRLCDRAIFMEKGQVVFSGSTADLLDRQDIVRAVLLGGSTFAGRPTRRPDSADLVRPTHSGLWPCCRPVASTSASVGWWRSTCRPRPLPGEILGLSGRTAPGRPPSSSCCRASGARRGQITMGDLDITSWSASRRAATDSGVPSRGPLWPGLTVHESVVLAISHRGGSPGRRPPYCLPTVRRAERRLREAADEVLEPLGWRPLRSADL